MEVGANGSNPGIFRGVNGDMPSIDLESSHSVIHALVDVMQRKFKKDTHYSRPLMLPQANILFALDKDAAESMIAYMTAELKKVGGFADGEFRFTRKCGQNGEGLQRVRLEFSEGVNARLLHKLHTIISTMETMAFSM